VRTVLSPRVSRNFRELPLKGSRFLFDVFSLRTMCLSFLPGQFPGCEFPSPPIPNYSLPPCFPRLPAAVVFFLLSQYTGSSIKDSFFFRAASAFKGSLKVPHLPLDLQTRKAPFPTLEIRVSTLLLKYIPFFLRVPRCPRSRSNSRASLLPPHYSSDGAIEVLEGRVVRLFTALKHFLFLQRSLPI